MRRELLILAVATGLLTGCAQTVWVKDGASQQDYRADSYDCERDARQSGYFGTGLVGAANFSNFEAECMEAHGWSRQAVTDITPVAAEDSHIGDREEAAQECEAQAISSDSQAYPQCFFQHFKG